MWRRRKKRGEKFDIKMFAFRFCSFVHSLVLAVWPFDWQDSQSLFITSHCVLACSHLKSISISFCLSLIFSIDSYHHLCECVG